MKFGTIMLAGEPCLVMQHNDGAMCLVDRLLEMADAGSAPTMLDLVHRLGNDPTLAATLSAAATGLQGKHAFAVDEQTDWLPPIGNPSKILGVAFNNRELMKKAQRLRFQKTKVLQFGSGQALIRWWCYMPKVNLIKKYMK